MGLYSTKEEEETLLRFLRYHTWEVSVGYIVMLFFCVMLLQYTSIVNAQLRSGDTSLQQKAILPTFRSMLKALAISSGIIMCINSAFIYTVDVGHSHLHAYIDMLLSGQHFTLVLAPIFMYQKSLSDAALFRSIGITIVFTMAGIPLAWIHGVPDYTFLYANWVITTVFFIYLAIRPPARAFKKVIRRYSIFAFVQLFFNLAHLELVRSKHLDIASPVASITSLWMTLTPYMVWKIIKSDTKYWRGKGKSSVGLQQLFSERIKLPERVSAAGFHMLIEMHRSHVLDFSCLGMKQQIGTGENSTVFSGVMRGKTPVACRVYLPSDLSDTVIAQYSQEAALCGNLTHPNIVRFHGLAVCPPSIIMVFELCRGTLRDIVQRSDSEYACKNLVTITQMLDAARAIAFLHSFKPPFIHDELDLSSFLVDTDGVVKLNGFGDSRLRSQFHPEKEKNRLKCSWRRRAGLEIDSEGMLLSTHKHSNSADTNDKAVETLNAERADVYALSMAFWEIIHPHVEMPRGGDELFNDPEWRPGFSSLVPVELQELVRCMWDSNIQMRPSAHDVVKQLEDLQEVALEDNVESVASTVSNCQISEQALTARERFTGSDAVRSLVMTNEVMFRWEGVRLCNAWMEAGFLHEERHLKRFQNKPDLRYYFSAQARMETSISIEDDSTIMVNTPECNSGSKSKALYRKETACSCQLHARRLALPRRNWMNAFGVYEQEMLSNTENTVSSSLENMLTSALVDERSTTSPE